MELPNGDVYPSNRSIGRTVSGAGNSFFDNSKLVKGEVVKVIYPKDDDSRSKAFIEYNVYFENSKNGTITGEYFYNCSLINNMGGLADKSSFVLRAASEPPEKKKEGFSDGSKVLILCVDGEASNAVIIGGLRDLNDESESKLTAKDNPGLNLSQTFNGINASIDKDGAFTLTFNGPTTNVGKLDTDKVKEEATGTVFKLSKEGNASISDKDDKNQFLINHKDSKIQSTADKEYNIKVNNGKIITDGTGLEFGKANEKVILGDTYRNAESQMHQKLSGFLQTMSNLALTAGTQLNTAGAVAGPIVGPQPGLAAAGAAMIALQSLFINFKAAIDTFEAQKAQYLSNKFKIE